MPVPVVVSAVEFDMFQTVPDAVRTILPPVPNPIVLEPVGELLINVVPVRAKLFRFSVP